MIGKSSTTFSPVLDSIKLAIVMLFAAENVSISITLPAAAGLLENVVENDDDANNCSCFQRRISSSTEYNQIPRRREES
jgi:hypothetical protein